MWSVSTRYVARLLEDRPNVMVILFHAEVGTALGHRGIPVYEDQFPSLQELDWIWSMHELKGVPLPGSLT